MICPECGSDDTYNSELRESLSHRCNSCGHWFDPADSELVTDVFTLHEEARGVGQDVGAEGMPFFVNPAMFPKEAQERIDAERSANDAEAWQMVRDDILAVPIVNGDNPPNFEVASATCENGCHTWIGLADTANDIGYTTPYTNIPTFLAQMQGYVDFNGNVNPTIARAIILAFQSTLN